MEMFSVHGWLGLAWLYMLLLAFLSRAVKSRDSRYLAILEFAMAVSAFSGRLRTGGNVIGGKDCTRAIFVHACALSF